MSWASITVIRHWNQISSLVAWVVVTYSALVVDKVTILIVVLSIAFWWPCNLTENLWHRWHHWAWESTTNLHTSASCLRRRRDMTMITWSVITHWMQVIPFHWLITCSRNGLVLRSVFFCISYNRPYRNHSMTAYLVLNFSSTKYLHIWSCKTSCSIEPCHSHGMPTMPETPVAAAL